MSGPVIWRLHPSPRLLAQLQSSYSAAFASVLLAFGPRSSGQSALAHLICLQLPLDLRIRFLSHLKTSQRFPALCSQNTSWRCSTNIICALVRLRPVGSPGGDAGSELNPGRGAHTAHAHGTFVPAPGGASREEVRAVQWGVLPCGPLTELSSGILSAGTHRATSLG